MEWEDVDEDKKKLKNHEEDNNFHIHEDVELRKNKPNVLKKVCLWGQAQKESSEQSDQRDPRQGRRRGLGPFDDRYSFQVGHLFLKLLFQTRDESGREW